MQQGEKVEPQRRTCVSTRERESDHQQTTYQGRWDGGRTQGKGGEEKKRRLREKREKERRMQPGCKEWSGVQRG